MDNKTAKDTKIHPVIMKAIQLGALMVPVVVAIATMPVKAQNQQVVTYRCSGGQTFQAAFSPNIARVRLPGNQTLILRQVPSGSGVRYSNGRTRLWTKGNEAFIEIGNRMVYRQCVSQQTSPSTRPTVTPSPLGTRLASVKGTVAYRQRIALPPNAMVLVRLQEVSRADKTVLTIAEKSINQAGQVPIPFELTYDASKINPSHTYAVQALILVDGKVIFKNTSAYPVITQGHPTTVEVVVEPVN